MSPVAHSAAGLLGWQLTAGKKNWKTLAVFVLLANLPDLDHALLFFMGKRGLELHQYFTHNIFFVTLTAIACWPLLNRMGGEGLGVKGKWRQRIGILMVSYSHLFLDLITIDHMPPIGFRPFYPLSSRFFNFGFFPNLHKGSLAEAVSLNNILVMSLEAVVILLPILWIYRKSFFAYIRQPESWKK